MRSKKSRCAGVAGSPPPRRLGSDDALHSHRVPVTDDDLVRLAAFRFLDAAVARFGDELPWQMLTTGFEWKGRRVPLVSQQGIFKPAVCELPLSIRTTPPVAGKEAPYDDEIGRDGLIRYRYRGNDPDHPENRGLREAMRRQTPLIYFYGIDRGIYAPLWPIFIVHDDPRSLVFTVAVDDAVAGATDSGLVRDEFGSPLLASEGTEARRRYITVTAQRRLHQSGFRRRVLRAYREQCAICRLRHNELLDAAHIVGDKHDGGDPVVPNGLAMCKLHHAAFDANILGVTPDFSIEIREDILHEIDGPMLVHGIQEFQGGNLRKPSSRRLWPDRDRLALRYERFRAA